MHFPILQLQMQMRSGGRPGGPHPGYRLPFGHLLPLGDLQSAAMGIERLYTIAMVDLKIETIGVVLSNIFYRSRRKGSNGVPLLSADVNAAMELIPAVNRMIPITVGGIQVPQNRERCIQFSRCSRNRV